jgi:hypothetical protein
MSTIIEVFAIALGINVIVGTGVALIAKFFRV